jgi:hypothetical protein
MHVSSPAKERTVPVITKVVGSRIVVGEGLTVVRSGYGAMKLTGDEVWGE